MQYPNLFPAITLFLVITIFSFIHLLSSSYADNEKHLNCSAPFDCAGMKGLNYPFWGSNRPNYCGHPAFELNCSNDVPLINITDVNYQILNISKVSRTLMVTRENYRNAICPATIDYSYRDINFPFFDYDSATTNLTFYYNCSDSVPIQLHTTRFDCSNSTYSISYGYYNSSSNSLLYTQTFVFDYGKNNYCLNSAVANFFSNSLEEKCRF